MHHPKILDFELDAVTGGDFEVLSLGKLLSAFCIWKTECIRY